MIKSFEEIEAWKNARILADRVFSLSRKGNFATDFGLKDQICRAAVSVMSNVAEGFECNSKRTFLRYLKISKGSAGEVRSLLYIAHDRAYISESDFIALHSLIRQISSQLANFQKHLQEML